MKISLACEQAYSPTCVAFSLISNFFALIIIQTRFANRSYSQVIDLESESHYTDAK